MGLLFLGCACPRHDGRLLFCIASPRSILLACGAPLPGRRRPICYCEADSRRCSKLCSCLTPAANRTALLKATSPNTWNCPRAALACLQTIMFNKTSGGGAAASAGAGRDREVSQAQRRGATPAPGPGVNQSNSNLSLDGGRQSSSHQVCYTTTVSLGAKGGSGHHCLSTQYLLTTQCIGVLPIPSSTTICCVVYIQCNLLGCFNVLHA